LGKLDNFKVKSPHDLRKTMKATFIYITAGSMDEAKKIGRALISKRLAACVNIIDNMHSMYWWEDEIQDDREVILIAKTKESVVPELIEKVKSMHSYDCPCIVSLPILDGNKAFLEWIAQQTK
jgi:periplasmic divalent cation tolerance protein